MSPAMDMIPSVQRSAFSGRQHSALKTGMVVNADTSIERRIQCLWCTGGSRLGGCFWRLHGRAIAGIAPVVVGIVGGKSLEATVYPKILFGYAANVRLQQGVEALDVANRVDAGKVLQRGPDH